MIHFEGKSSYMTNVTSPILKQKLTITYFLVSIFLLIIVDVSIDVLHGLSVLEFMQDFAIDLAILIAVFFMVREVWKSFSDELENTKKSAQYFEQKSKDFIGTYHQFVFAEFDKWSFTATEKDIALLLLKGLSFKEIAARRFTSERTVRNQCANIYQKSGQAGKSEFNAYFLRQLVSDL